MSYCTACGRPCKGTVLDYGIGPYEYWGQRGVDTDKRLVSECCEAEVSATEDGHSIYSFSDLEEDRRADAAEARRAER